MTIRLCALTAAIVAERDWLGAQVNLPQICVNVVIDRRSLTGSLHVSTATSQFTQVLTPSQAMTAIEREALERAVSARFLAQEGWTKGPDGEIGNSKGRRLYEHGYATALRKLLA